MTKSELIKHLQAIEHIDPCYEISLQDDWLLFVCSPEFVDQLQPGVGGIATGDIGDCGAIDVSIPAVVTVEGEVVDACPRAYAHKYDVTDNAIVRGHDD